MEDFKPLNKQSDSEYASSLKEVIVPVSLINLTLSLSAVILCVVVCIVTFFTYTDNSYAGWLMASLFSIDRLIVVYKSTVRQAKVNYLARIALTKLKN